MIVDTFYVYCLLMCYFDDETLHKIHRNNPYIDLCDNLNRNYIDYMK